MSNPTLPSCAIPLGAAVTEAYLLEAAPPKGRSPSPPVGWTQVGNPVSGYLRLSHAWENFGLWYQNNADPGQWLLAIRGTVTKADGEADADTTPTDDFVPFKDGISVQPTPKVHPGFYHLYTDTQTGSVVPSMQAQIFTQLQALLADTTNPLTTLYITGHSLGGALANLVSLDVAISQLLVKAKATAATVTWAAPKVGPGHSWGAAYASMVSTSYAITNQYDIVPSQPKIPGWVDVGQAFDILFYYQAAGVPGKDELITRHSMSKYLFVVTQALANSNQTYEGTFADSVFVGQTDTSQDPSPGNLAQAAQDLASAVAALGAGVTVTPLVAP